MNNKEILNNTNSSSEELSSEEPIKRKPGRPKGSQNKNKKTTKPNVYQLMADKYQTPEEKQELKKIEKESKQSRALTQQEKDLRDYIYKNFLIILGYDQDSTYQLEKQYLMQKVHAMAQGLKRGQPLSDKEFTYGLGVIARTIRDHRGTIILSIKNKDFNGDERYKINYICKIIKNYLNQTYRDMKNDKIAKEVYQGALKREEEVERQLKDSSRRDVSGPTVYEQERWEKESKKTWRQDREDLW